MRDTRSETPRGTATVQTCRDAGPPLYSAGDATWSANRQLRGKRTINVTISVSWLQVCAFSPRTARKQILFIRSEDMGRKSFQEAWEIGRTDMSASRRLPTVYRSFTIATSARVRNATPTCTSPPFLRWNLVRSGTARHDCADYLESCADNGWTRALRAAEIWMTEGVSIVGKNGRQRNGKK